MMGSALSMKAKYVHKTNKNKFIQRFAQTLPIHFYKVFLQGARGRLFFQKKFPPHKISPYLCKEGAP